MAKLNTSETPDSLIEQFLHEIGEDETALLDARVVIFHRLGHVLTDIRREGVVFLRCQHE